MLTQKKMALCSIIFISLISTSIFALTYYVNVNNFGATAPYTNWATAATVIQDAVDLAGANDTVIVTNGVYTLGGAVTPGYSLNNRVVIQNQITVQSVNGPENTIIYGQGPNGVGAVRCVYLYKASKLIGFTLSNGHTLVTGDNIYERGGGGILLKGDNIVSNCIIKFCAADHSGGGIAIDGVGTVIDSIIIQNSSDWNGGGIICKDGGELLNSTVIGNVATNWGGGILFDAFGIVEKCVISRNIAYYGGGFYCNGEGFINNSLIEGNNALQDGAGVFLNGDVEIKNSTICGNNAVRDGGGIICRFSGTNLNTLIYHNTAGRNGMNHQEIGSGGYYAYCCTTPAVTGQYNGSGNIFVDPEVSDLLAGDYGLSSSSPCIGIGNNLYAPGNYDIDGRQRILGSPQIVDIGCFEFVPEATGAQTDHYVSPAGGNFWPYDTEQKAALNIQDAIDAAAHSDTVYVDDGVYNRAYRGAQGMKNRIAVKKNISILANSTDPARVVILGEADLLSGEMGTSAVRCVYLKSFSALVSGLTLSNGFTRGTDGPTLQDLYQGFGGTALIDGYGVISNCVLSAGMAIGGGGVFCNDGGIVAHSSLLNNHGTSGGGGVLLNSKCLIHDCIIDGNSSESSGGGVFLMNNPTLAAYACVENSFAVVSEPTMENCTVSDNYANFGGGGVYTLVCGLLKNCHISKNQTAGPGAGILFYKNGKIENSVISQNANTDSGGGIMFDKGGSAFNCLIIKNSAINGGGAFFNEKGILESCTVASNSAVHGGGGVYCDSGGSNINSIIYDNKNFVSGTTNYYNSGSGAYYSYCNIYPEISGAPNGPGNITNSPDFNNPAVSDFHLTDISPCIDAGTNLPWMISATDLDGNDRIQDGTVDIGCYEYIPEPGVFGAINSYLLLVLGIYRKF